MTSHRTGTREEWRTARLQLLEAEKDLTRRSDALAEARQALNLSHGRAPARAGSAASVMKATNEGDDRDDEAQHWHA